MPSFSKSFRIHFLAFRTDRIAPERESKLRHTGFVPINAENEKRTILPQYAWIVEFWKDANVIWISKIEKVLCDVMIS